MKLATKICFSLPAILAQLAFAASSVAVPDIVVNAGAQKSIEAEELRYLSDELRRQAAGALPASDYKVSASPASAEYASRGSIGKFGGKLTISVELYEGYGGENLLSSFSFESESIDGLLGAIKSEARQMFQSILPKPAIPAAAAIPSAPAAPAAPAGYTPPLMRQAAPAAAGAFSALAAGAAPPAPRGISASCLEEFVSVGSFDVASLSTAAVKVKAQSKAPLQFLLGPGPDNKMTDAGISVGCLKALPESAPEATALLKDLLIYASFKAGKDIAADLVNAAAAGAEGNSASGGNGAKSETRFGLRAVYGEFIGISSDLSISSFQIGFVASFPVIHTELSFSRKSYAFDYDYYSYGYYSTYSTEYNYSILNADVLYRGCPFGGPAFYMEGGARAGYAIKAISDSYEDIDYNRGYFDFGLAGGFGWNIGSHFAPGFRAVRYFTNPYRDEGFLIESGLSFMF